MKAQSILLFILISHALSADTTFYGPQAFVRQKAGPTDFSEAFAVCRTDGAFTLHVVNGDPGGNNKVSSAAISINNVEVVKQSDFNQNTSAIDKTGSFSF
jgi:hypothetical protein